jgi:hypothetical protein
MARLRLCATFSALLLVVGIRTVEAVDGQVLISQASVTAAGGFPYRITQSGSYKLSSNIIVSGFDTDAIQIFADNVTLDLNGFSITGPWFAASGHVNGTGIYSPNSNITISNGKTTGFPQGIFLKGSSAVVERVTVTGNDFGIDSWGDSTFVDRITARNNRLGIYFQGSGMITNSMLSQNTSFGIYVGVAGGYGANTILSNGVDVVGGTSMGNNVCTVGKC